MKKIKILVCCHKESPFIRNNAPYLPIQVGKALNSELNLGFLNDDDGESISEKNLQYCELTALYWGWKNLKNIDYKGLCHYRRYFDIDINDENVNRLMEGYDILVVNKSYQRMPIADILASWTTWEDFYIFADTLLCMYPDYKHDFERYFLNGYYFYPCTMFVATSEVYDKFCEFLFPLFFEMDKKLLSHGYSRLNRFIAYCGEVILGLFILHDDLKVKTVSMIEEGVKKHNHPYLYALRHYLYLGFIRLTLFNHGRRTLDNMIPNPATLAMKGDGVKLSIIKNVNNKENR